MEQFKPELRIRQNEIRHFLNHIQNLKVDNYIELPSGWAEKNRYLPEGTTEFPGYWNNTTAPYDAEIMDQFHPDNPTRVVSVMKSTQSTLTTAIENVIGHCIKYKLASILYVIATKGSAGIRSSAAIDVMIDYSGLAEHIKPLSDRNKRKTADKALYKEFAGNLKFSMTSYNSIADLKSVTYGLIIMDELDEAPLEIKDQGDPEGIIEVRGTTVRGLKIAKISTPTNAVTSRIYKNFLAGDQRYYFAQCQRCGEHQVLKLMAQDRKYGLTADTVKDKQTGVISIVPGTTRYICKHCGKENYEYEKQEIMNGGEWRPTAISKDPLRRSYHVNGMMSPRMFLSWDRFYQEYVNTDYGRRFQDFKNFVLVYLGEAFETQAEKRDWKDLLKKAEEYAREKMPPGGIIITGGVDVHKTHLDLQLVAWGVGMESWSIDHKIFYGNCMSLDDISWKNLLNYAKKKYLVFNSQVHAYKIAVDSGYGYGKQREDDFAGKDNIVYDFCALNPTYFIAVKGNPDSKDIFLKESRVTNGGLLKRRYDINVSLAKEEIFARLDLTAGPGAMHFTKKIYDEIGSVEHFFKQMVSEKYVETQQGKWEWKKHYENHALDAWIYARAAAEYLGLSAWTEGVWQHHVAKLTDVM